MAAGLGFKTFTTGEVLTAGDTNGYLMQGILVFATEAARNAAITAPAEGQFAFTKDTNSTWYYDGAAWVLSGAAAAAGVNSNKVINGNFAINQRLYISAANLASGAYGLDRWKSNFTNTTLSFTAAVNGNQLTINSGGGIQQVVERQVIPAGNNTLSWEGTATARMYNSGAGAPSYAASPITVNLDGLQNVVVEFTAAGGTRTVSNVKLEAGTTASAFVLAGLTTQGELAACQRYYYQTNVGSGGSGSAVLGSGWTSGSTDAFYSIPMKQTMRSTPSFSSSAANTFAVASPAGGIAGTAITSGLASVDNTRVQMTVASGLTSGNGTTLQGNSDVNANLKFSAEL